MSIVEQGPGVAALQIKNYILAGVDQTTELQTQTLSGGRLNINNSLVSLLEICGTCVTPVAPFAQQLEGSLDYTINWVSVADVNYTVLRYRILGICAIVFWEIRNGPLSIILHQVPICLKIFWHVVNMNFR